MPLQLMLTNGARFAFDPVTNTAIEENIETDAGAKGSAIVYAANHRFVTSNHFDDVFNEWILELETGEDEDETETGAAANTGINPNGGQPTTT